MKHNGDEYTLHINITSINLSKSVRERNIENKACYYLQVPAGISKQRMTYTHYGSNKKNSK